MVSLISFSNYVLAVCKRLDTHFGIDYDLSKKIVESNRSFVFDGYQKRIAADRVARILADRFMQMSQTHRANPTSFTHNGVPIVIETADDRWVAWVLWPDGRKLFAGYSRKSAADAAQKGARFIDKMSSKQVAVSENPLPSNMGLWFGAMIVTAVGVYFIADALKTKTPSQTPNFTPQRPEVLKASVRTSSTPYGVPLENA